MKPKAWIFDLGNTLMSIPDAFDEEACLCELLGYRDTDEVRRVIYSLCDRYTGQTIAEFLDRFDAAVDPASNDERRREIRRVWRASVDAAILKPAAHAVLDRLRESGVRLALVSNTPPTSWDILERLDLKRRFDAIVFSCDVGYLKPDPRIFKVALDRMQVDAADAVVVGDKIRTDILGGAILGMRSILVEERLRSSIENSQNYVDAIVTSVAAVAQTTLFRATVNA